MKIRYSISREHIADAEQYPHNKRNVEDEAELHPETSQQLAEVIFQILINMEENKNGYRN